MFLIVKKRRDFENGSDKKEVPFFNKVAHEDDLRYLEKQELYKQELYKQKC